MTLRQLLREYNYKQIFNLIYKLFLKNKGLDHNNIIDIDLDIHSLFMYCKNLSVNKNDSLRIYFTQVSNETIDLLILDEVQDEVMDFDTLNRADLIDLEIYKAVEIEDLTCLAYIFFALYQQLPQGKKINLWQPKYEINDDEFQK